MASTKARKITRDEWNHHKEVIRDLFAQNRLNKVIQKMEEDHGFIATLSQYEAQLRIWGFKKNLSQKQWREHFAGIVGPENPELVTSSGRVKDKKKVKRAERYLKKISSVNKPAEPSQTTDLTVFSPNAQPLTTPNFEESQHTALELSPSRILSNTQNPMMAFEKASLDWPFNGFIFGNLPQIGFNLSEFACPQVLSGPLYLGANINPLTANINQQVVSQISECDFNMASTHQTQQEPLSCATGFGYGNHGQIEGNMENLHDIPQDMDNFNLEEFLQSSPFSQNPSTETAVFHKSPVTSTVGMGLSISLGFRKEWLRKLPFTKFEAFLSSRDLTFKSTSNNAPRMSLSSSLTFMFISNQLSGSGDTMTRPSDVQTIFQRLADLSPRDSRDSAVISNQQMQESNMIRLLLFSMMNGFAGLNDIPIERVLSSLRRLGFFNTSFLPFLREAPSHTSRTFVDNLFRSAIDAKDEQTVRLLLEHKLVDVNTTVCRDRYNRRFTPLERAASLQAFKVIQNLVEYGADANQSYRKEGVLHSLLMSLKELKEVIPAPELIAAVKLLIEKGSRVTLDLLTMIGDTFVTHEMGSLLSRAISITDHREFFIGVDESRVRYWANLRAEILRVSVASKLQNTETSASIIGNLISICKSHGGACLAESPEEMENAAVLAAVRGRLKIVKLLIDYAKSTDRILCAAIKSGNSDLIQFVLGRNPNLDSLESSLPDSGLYPPGFTTPLAEAIRAGNNEMILHIENCGALTNLTETIRLEVAIHAAAEVGNISWLMRLLPIASSTKVKFRVSIGAIKLAVMNGHMEAAYLLIQQGATKYDRYDRHLALELALRKRDSKMVAAILSTDISITHINVEVFKWAEPTVVESLLFVTPDLNMESPQGEDFCSYCMETSNFDLFRKVIESTTHIELSLDGCLKKAIQKGHRTMALYLLRTGANPFNPEVLAAAIPDRPEMLSLLFGNDREEWQQAHAPPKCVGANILKVLMNENNRNAEALDGLLRAGTVNLTFPEEIKTRDGLNLTPLGLAILGIPEQCNTNMAAIQKFLDAGADPNATARLETEPHRCVTGLMAALETGREDVVNLMIKNGADINLQPRLTLRRTPLQYAAQLGKLDMVQLLISLGADVDSPPAFQAGGTALQFAAISGNCNMVAELLEKGARLDIPPSRLDGRWPLEGAAEHGRLDMIQMLWNARELSPNNAGFEKRQCLRAMDFAQENGHLGCRDLLAELSGLSVEMLDTEEYGVPWLASETWLTDPIYSFKLLNC